MSEILRCANLEGEERRQTFMLVDKLDLEAAPATVYSQ
jgi:hypothetical protein